MLRRHLPTGTFVGSGFIVSRERSSTQIDLLVVKPGHPTLFREGDVAIVSPSDPAVIVEIKSELRGEAEWYDALLKLARNGELCKTIGDNLPWLGLFSYQGSTRQADTILEMLCRVHRDTRTPINCISAGRSLFVRYWPTGEHEAGDDRVVDGERKYWRAYDLGDLAPSYFISNLVDGVCDLDRTETDYVWFAYPDGKRQRRLSERRCEECE